MGRPKKPLKSQKGNLTTEQKNLKKRAEKAVKIAKNDIKKVPKWLINDVAKKEYRRAIKELSELDIITNLDINNLGAYCNSYAMYLKATEELEQTGLTVLKELPNGSTNIVENPLVKIQKNYASEMRAFASLVGLTIDSRLKIGTSKISEENNEINKIFGEII